jgi:hypothetical protein
VAGIIVSRWARPRPTVEAVRGTGDDQVLVGRQVHRVRQLRCCLAACFAALLAIAPVTRQSLPVHLAAVSALPEAFVAQGNFQGQGPATALWPAQTVTLGILSRLLSVETALRLPPGKPPLLRPVAEQPVVARPARIVPGGRPRVDFDPSSVGTARTPTGPPT